MNLDDLITLRDRAYLAGAVTTKPGLLTGPCLVAASPAAIEIEGVPVQIVVPMRNVGDEGCRITQVNFDISGIKVLEGLSTGDLFPAQQAEKSAARIVLEFVPFELSPTAQQAWCTITAESIESRRSTFLKVHLQLTRTAAAGTLLLFSPPRVIFSDLRVGNYRLFQCRVSGSKATLFLNQGGDTQRYAMQKRDGSFAIAVPVREGPCTYCFEVDGKFYSDEQVPAINSITADGVRTSGSYLHFAASERQMLKIKNSGKVDAQAEFTTEVPWLRVSPQQASIEAEGYGHVEVLVDTAKLPAGSHQAFIHYTLKKSRNTRRSGTIQVDATVDSSGPFPEPINDIKMLGRVYYGTKVVKEILLKNLGAVQGKDGAAMHALRGSMTTDDRSISPAQLEPLPGLDQSKLSIVIEPQQSLSAAPHPQRSKLIVTTNSPAYDRREMAITIVYELCGLRIEPEQLSVGTISPGEEREFIVEIRQGDGKSLAAEEISVNNPLWATVRSLDRGRFQVVFKSTGLTERADGPFSRNLEFKHEKTGAIGILKIEGVLALPQAETQTLNFENVRRGTAKELPLPIKNRGKGTLRIEQVILNDPWLDARVSQGQLLIIANTKVDDGTELWPWPRKYKGSVTVVTNDLQHPQARIPVEMKVVK
ncbi:MAG TPA: hypothetical protein VJW20_01930 [Candidatus Angelobacter sp.]|nr:hypothetical protein [Candidatus Angelobacter sp.]